MMFLIPLKPTCGERLRLSSSKKMFHVHQVSKKSSQSVGRDFFFLSHILVDWYIMKGKYKKKERKNVPVGPFKPGRVK